MRYRFLWDANQCHIPDKFLRQSIIKVHYFVSCILFPAKIIATNREICAAQFFPPLQPHCLYSQLPIMTLSWASKIKPSTKHTSWPVFPNSLWTRRKACQHPCSDNVGKTEIFFCKLNNLHLLCNEWYKDRIYSNLLHTAHHIQVTLQSFLYGTNCWNKSYLYVAFCV